MRSNEIRMPDRVLAPIRQMKREGFKWAGQLRRPQLLDRHRLFLSSDLHVHFSVNDGSSTSGGKTLGPWTRVNLRCSPPGMPACMWSPSTLATIEPNCALFQPSRTKDLPDCTVILSTKPASS